MLSEELTQLSVKSFHKTHLKVTLVVNMLEVIISLLLLSSSSLCVQKPLILQVYSHRHL